MFELMQLCGGYSSTSLWPTSLLYPLTNVPADAEQADNVHIAERRLIFRRTWPIYFSILLQLDSGPKCNVLQGDLECYLPTAC
jgi:hypothetical protein